MNPRRRSASSSESSRFRRPETKHVLVSVVVKSLDTDAAWKAFFKSFKDKPDAFYEKCIGALAARGIFQPRDLLTADVEVLKGEVELHCVLSFIQNRKWRSLPKHQMLSTSESSTDGYLLPRMFFLIVFHAYGYVSQG